MDGAQQRKQDKLDTVRRMYLSGSCREEIAQETGYTVLTVGQFLSGMGLLPHRTGGSRTQEILRLDDEGMKLREISAQVGLSMGRVSRILNKNGRRRTGQYGSSQSGSKSDQEFEGLINEHTVYADNRHRVYLFRDRGKKWQDITELFGR